MRGYYCGAGFLKLQPCQWLSPVFKHMLVRKTSFILNQNLLVQSLATISMCPYMV